MIKLISTSSYFNLFPILAKDLCSIGGDLTRKNLVFCEAKVSLLVERYLCSGEIQGSFNTDVYSFGKFLCARNKKLNKVLSKEGSAMAIKRIISKTKLECFKSVKNTLAPTLYDLITQLKSAKVTADDILLASNTVKGRVLKNKLKDIYAVYSEYERFISEKGFDDQSSLLDMLPDIINEAEDIPSTDVYIVGFSSFTAQMRSAISALMKRAKSFTAILVEGENIFSYVNETSRFIRDEAKSLNLDFTVDFTYREGNFSAEGKLIADNLFNPVLNLSSCDKGTPYTRENKNLYFHSAINPQEEIMRVGEIIKRAVIDKDCKYKDFTIAVGNPDIYRDDIKSVFHALDVPYYLDEKIAPINHPLITLILSYVDVFRKGFEREAVCAFYKNPLFNADKNLGDIFENYTIKYNVNYRRIFEEFNFKAKDDEQTLKLEKFRRDLCAHFYKFDVANLLENLDVENKLKAYATVLRELGEVNESEVTTQIYGAVTSILKEMKDMLEGITLSYTEFKNLFISGVSALNLSIIPQYNDAVFIGGYREVSVAKAKRLFAIGLTSEVPDLKADVALLSDSEISEISLIEQIKEHIEPKIRVVNHRTKESVAMGLSSFSDRLYLSYPISTVDGKKNFKSEIISDIERLFKFNEFPPFDGYLTVLQGYDTFAKACGEFAEGRREGDFHYDFTIPSSFYMNADKKSLTDMMKRAQKDLVERLEGENVSLIKSNVYATDIEEFYACPYRAFATKTLGIRERDKGEVDSMSVGILMHAIFQRYVKRLDEVNDEQSSDKLFDEIKTSILDKPEYKKYLAVPATKATVVRVLTECKKYCYKTYLSISKSDFTECKTEVWFGDENSEYPAIKLLDGKVSLKGKIDRVDEGENFFRVLDYKTGKAEASDTALFAGVKLQLYLYAAAVMEKYKDKNPKFPAGLYYLPVKDKYDSPDDKLAFSVGKTLAEMEAVKAIDKEFERTGKTDYASVTLSDEGEIKNGTDRISLVKCLDYALAICAQGAKHLSEGVIKPSPYRDACKYCEMSALCGLYNATPRSVGNVSAVLSNKKDKKQDKKQVK